MPTKPARRNALDRAMWQALARAADEVATRLPRAVVITGAGDAFTAGMDVNPDNPMVAGVAAAMATGDVAPARAMLAEIHAALDRLFALPVPLIAAIGGLAYGGGAEIAHAGGAKLVVDNVFATPLLQQPMALGADVVVYSATKHIDGQGRCLGGVILGSQKLIDENFTISCARPARRCRGLPRSRWPTRSPPTDRAPSAPRWGSCAGPPICPGPTRWPPRSRPPRS